MKSKELKDTVKGMTSTDYKERFVAEYEQLTIRINKLHDFIIRIENEKPEPKHDCPVELLKEQLSQMRGYQYILTKRAKIENIEL